MEAQGNSLAPKSVADLELSRVSSSWFLPGEPAFFPKMGVILCVPMHANELTAC